ncbi:MAG: Glu-tRNA(Gln) amidotransferase GatDE subunit E, partial [Nanoarchaeota archaeon]
MLDYKELGLRIGLEIHQQISSQKLFCKCSTQFKEKDLELEFLRKLKASAGELGYVDVAAEFEQSRDREFFYHGYKNEYCLVDCD